MCSEKCDEDEFGIIERWFWMMEIKGKGLWKKNLLLRRVFKEMN